MRVVSPKCTSAACSDAVDGSGTVQTIYGRAPRSEFPTSATHCLTGLHVLEETNATTVHVLDACQGFMIAIDRGRE